MTENYLPLGNIEYRNNTPWIDVAVEEMKKNILETGSNPEIFKYFDYTQLKGTNSSKTDKTPWGAAFVNYCMEISNINGTNSAMAYSFKQWGNQNNTINLSPNIINLSNKYVYPSNYTPTELSLL